MKGDFTKNTYARRKHYAGVLMQQGRVELDADWNEQNDIVAHREGTTTLDTIGASGAPIHDAGFAVVAALADLPAEDKARPENAKAANWRRTSTSAFFRTSRTCPRACPGCS